MDTLSIAEWRTLMERVPEVSPIVDISCVLSPEHEFLAVNEEAAAIHGMQPEEFHGRRCYELVHGTEEPIDECPCEEVLRTGEPAESDPFEEDGRYYVAAAAPIEDDAGETVALAHTVRDVTDQERRKQELERERDRLDEFASVVSHDLRNPLNVAQARLELAMEETDCEHHDAIADALDRIERIIGDVLWLGREGREIGETGPVDLREAVENAWQVVEHEADAELVYAAEDPEDPVTVDADSNRLRQLVENLLCNAVEHAGPVVTIRVEELDSGFAFEDDGPGIDPDHREQVFEAGYSTAEGGTGFGLNIVERVADAHGWDIHLTEGKDGGARFEITTG